MEYVPKHTTEEKPLFLKKQVYVYHCHIIHFAFCYFYVDFKYFSSYSNIYLFQSPAEKENRNHHID